MTVAVTPGFLGHAGKRAALGVADAWPDGYPVVVPRTAWYDPATEVAVVYGPAEARAVVDAVTITPEGDDALSVQVDLDDLTLEVPLHDASGELSCAMPVALPGASVRFTLMVARNKVGKAEPIAVLPAELVPGEGGGPDTAACAELGASVAALVAERATDAARAQLESSFVASIAPVIGDVLPLRMPTGRAVTVPSLAGPAGALSTRLTAVGSDAGASVLHATPELVSLDADLSIDSTRHGCVPDVALPPIAPSSAIALPATVPGGGAYDVAVRFSEDALGHALAHAWRGGLLCGSVGTKKVPTLTTATLAPWLPGLGSLADAAPVWIRYWTEEPPTVTFGDGGSGPGGLTLTVAFRHLRADLYAEVEETRLLLFALDADVALTTRVELAPGDGTAALRLVVDGVDTDGMTVTSPLHDGPLPGSELAAQLWETALGAVLETTTWLALPTGTWDPTLLAAVRLGPGQAALFLGVGTTPAPRTFAPGPLGLAPNAQGAAPAASVELPPADGAWRLDGRLWRSLAQGALVAPAAGTGVHLLEVRLGETTEAGYFVADAAPAPPTAGCEAGGAAPPWGLLLVLAWLLGGPAARMMAPPLAERRRRRSRGPLE